MLPPDTSGTAPNQDNMNLHAMPAELLGYLTSFLPLDALLALRLVHSTLNNVVSTITMPQYLRRISYAPVTVGHWPHDDDDRRETRAAKCLWADRVARDGWHEWTDVAGSKLGEQEGNSGQWPARCMPVVRLWDRSQAGLRGRVVVARGGELDFWEVARNALTGSEWEEKVPIHGVVRESGREGKVPPTAGQRQNRRFEQQRPPSRPADITGVVPVSPTELVVSRVSGQVQRVKVCEPTWAGQWLPGHMVETARYSVSPGHDLTSSTIVQALHGSDNLLAVASSSRVRPRLRPRRSSGTSQHARLSTRDPVTLAAALSSRVIPLRHSVSAVATNAPWKQPALVNLPAGSGKPWSVLLSPSTSSSKWLAIGSTGTEPLSLGLLDNGGTPVGSAAPIGPTLDVPTSVYALCSPVATSTTFHPDHTVISASYDAHVRVYDLRAPSLGRPAAIELTDPWSDDPCYSVSSGGPGGSFIVCGTARNGAVRVWDVRQTARPVVDDLVARSNGGGVEPVPCDTASRRSTLPSPGVTFFTPGQDRSPVYGVAVEYSRIWAVTERRAVVVDFEGGRKRVRAVRNDNSGQVPFYRHEEGAVLRRTRPRWCKR